jgi:hypothetical protein
MLVSSDIIPYFSKAGIIPFNGYFESDHRALFIDVDLPRILKGMPHDPISRNNRAISSTIPCKVKKYQQYVFQECKASQIFSRTKDFEIRNKGIPMTPELHKELDAMDLEMTAIQLEAEKLCKARRQFPWSPLLKSCNNRIRYWRLWIRELRRHKDYGVLRATIEVTFEVPIGYPTLREAQKQLHTAITAIYNVQKQAAKHRLELLKNRACFLSSTGEGSSAAIVKRIKNAEAKSSGLQLGHDKTMVHKMLQDVDIDLTAAYFDHKARMINLALDHRHVYTHWQTVITTMIEKIPGVPRLDKLRVIHIIESDFNLWMGIVCGQQMIFQAESMNLLGDEQSGSRPEKRCQDVVIFKHMTYSVLRLARSDGITFDNDAKSCFDRIVLAAASLVLQRLGLSREVMELFIEALSKVEYFAKNVLRIVYYAVQGDKSSRHSWSWTGRARFSGNQLHPSTMHERELGGSKYHVAAGPSTTTGIFWLCRRYHPLVYNDGQSKQPGRVHRTDVNASYARDGATVGTVTESHWRKTGIV